MFDGRTRLASQVADEVREHFGEVVLESIIPRSVRVSEAPSYGQSVMTYDPGSSGAVAYLEAAREMAHPFRPRAAGRGLTTAFRHVSGASPGWPPPPGAVGRSRSSSGCCILCSRGDGSLARPQPAESPSRGSQPRALHRGDRPTRDCPPRAGRRPAVLAGCPAGRRGMACSCPGAGHLDVIEPPGMLRRRRSEPARCTRPVRRNAAARRGDGSAEAGTREGSRCPDSCDLHRSPRLAVRSAAVSPAGPGRPRAGQPSGVARGRRRGAAGHGRGSLLPGAAHQLGHPEPAPAAAGVR